MYYYSLIKDFIVKNYQLNCRNKLKNFSKQVYLFYSIFSGKV